MPLDLPIERAYALAVKLQPTRGTNSAPSMAADAIRIGGPFKVATDWMTRNDGGDEQSGGKGSAPDSPPAGRIHRYTSITRRMRGRGVAYVDGVTLPHEHALLMAILGGHNFNAGSPQYFGVDEGESLLSVLGQTMKREFVGTDVVPASASLELMAGGFWILNVALDGVGSPPAQQALEAATLDTLQTPTWVGGSLTLGGVALAARKVTIDFGLELTSPIEDPASGDAFVGWAIANRDVTADIEIQVPDMATFNPWDKMSTREELALVIHNGEVATRSIQIEADRLQIRDVEETNNGGLLGLSLKCKIHRSSTGKDPMITFPGA